MNVPQTVIANSVVEILNRFYGDVSFELAPAIFGGLIIGAFTMIGGLFGGQFGLLMGSTLGNAINSHFGSKILTLRQIIQKLDAIQIQNMCVTLSKGIIIVVHNMLGLVLNPGINITNLLDVFSGNSTVRSSVIQIVTNFLRGIYGNRLKPIKAN